MNPDRKDNSPQRIVVFQQKGSGERKVAGVRKYGDGSFTLEMVSIDDDLPPVLDDTSEFLPEDIDADLVLDYLKHGDLAADLAELCARKKIPIIASGKKKSSTSVLTPPTCCGLPRQDGLGSYGSQFGTPEFEVEIEDGIITEVRVVRGAPCGASWEAGRRLIGTSADDAARKIGLDTQFYCFADPAGWDPIHGKSPVHFAGKVHSRALAKAVEEALKRR